MNKMAAATSQAGNAAGRRRGPPGHRSGQPRRSVRQKWLKEQKAGRRVHPHTGHDGPRRAGNGGPSLALDVSALGPTLSRLPSGSTAARDSKVIKVLAARTLGAVGGLRTYIVFPALSTAPTGSAICHPGPSLLGRCLPLLGRK